MNETYDAMTQFEAMVQKIGDVIRNQMLREPPKLDAGLLDLAAFARMGLDIRRLTPDFRHRLLQMLTSSAYDLIERWFDSSMIKSMYASACFSGKFASLRYFPRAPRPGSDFQPASASQGGTVSNAR